ncbi:MAG: ABC-2 family transporter protein [Chloroflexota bacterium]
MNFYRIQFRVIIATQLQYRVALIIWLLGLVLQPLIYLVVWSTVTRSTGGTVGGYSNGDFAAYFIILMVVNHATFSWVMYGFDQRVRLGTLSPFLLRPVHLIHTDIAENFSYKILTLPVVLVTAALLTTAFHPVLHVRLWAVLAFAPSLILAILMRFLIEWAVSLIAFWTTRANAVNQIYEVAALFLSGQVAPLSLFPPPVQIVGDVLPFRWMVGFPVELLQGRLAPHQVLAGLGAQILWLALAFVAMRILWSAGVRRYSAVGS